MIMENPNMQTPYSNNNVSNEKPSVPRTINILQGDISNSMNGGINRTIAWKKCMAGEKHHEYRVGLNIQMLTPLTPAYQNLKCTLRAFYVPNSRVWTNAEAYTAQRGGSSEEKIKEIPNFGGKSLRGTHNIDDDAWTIITNTEYWKKSWVSSYLGRHGVLGYNEGSDNISSYCPDMYKESALKLRGMVAIYNDFLRNKEYDSPLQEYKGDTVTSSEWQRYNLSANEMQNLDIWQMRAKRDNSYYSDYRTELQGFEESYPPTNMSADVALLTWAQWESRIAQARSEAEMANLTDWEIIARIRGSKKLSEGKVQLIGQQTFNLNYSAITQNTYNNAAENSAFKVMGKQGAYSYTNVDIPVYAGFETVEEGYIHIIMTVSADTVYEYGVDRNELNVTPLSEYKPDLIGDKKDVLLEAERGTPYLDSGMTEEDIAGFKRRYSELFKLPSIIAGDMTNQNYFAIMTSTANTINVNDAIIDETHQLESQRTYQFFEMSAHHYLEGYANNNAFPKKPWLDYTDLMINKNQAIMNQVGKGIANGSYGTCAVLGQDQIFFVGKCTLFAELPVDQSIASSYTVWGEH